MNLNRNKSDEEKSIPSAFINMLFYWYFTDDYYFVTISLQDSTRPPTSWAICSCCCQDDIPSLLASASRCLYQSFLSPPFFKSFPRGFQGIVRFCSVTCIVYASPFPSSFHVSTLESTCNGWKKKTRNRNKTKQTYMYY